jgi:hypothetical protein
MVLTSQDRANFSAAELLQTAPEQIEPTRITGDDLLFALPLLKGMRVQQQR